MAGRLFALLAALSVAAPAHAEAFDLHCRLLGDDGQVARGGEVRHLQVDTTVGRWCEGACRESSAISELAGDGAMMLQSHDFMRVYYDPAQGQLVTSLLSHGVEDVRRISQCEVQDFSEFAPYLARDARLRSYSTFAGAFFGNRPSGLRRPSGDDDVRLRLEIDPAGAVSSCEAVSENGLVEFETLTCGIVDRFNPQFDPALDRDGMPTQGSFETTVVFR